MKYHYAIALTVGSALLLSGCGAGAPAEPEKSVVSAGAPTTQASPSSAPVKNPFDGAPFDVAPNGDPRIDASGGTDPDLVITPIFWDNPDSDLGVTGWYEFSTGGSVGGLGMQPLDISDHEIGEKGEIVVWYANGFIHIFGDGTAHWEFDTKRSGDLCPNQGPPVTREAANLTRGSDGAITSFTLDAPGTVSAVDCIAWTTASFPVIFTRG